VHADLSRWTFRPERHYSRVVVQQGRVSLDADANAQASILLHYLRALAADLIGEFGGPSGDKGFTITTNTDPQGKATLGITSGHYYVDGLLCEAEVQPDGTTSIDYFQQPDGYGAMPDLPASTDSYLVWLKVWERFISAVEDPDLREIALGLNGPDTTGRARVVWQVLWSQWDPSTWGDANTSWQQFYDGFWATVKADLLGEPPGTLMARAVLPQPSTDACTLSPSSGYRGPENQLYLVEIHRDGTAVAATTTSVPAASDTTVPTFTWSRDAGSVIFPITGISDSVVSVTTLGRDPKLSVDVGNYVEIVDDAYASQGTPGPISRYAEPLHLVTAVDPVQLTVTLDAGPATVGKDPSRHPYLRRWDQDKVLVTKAGLTIDSKDQAMDIVVTTDGTWIDLEDGVQVQFSAGFYRAGDYWLIPARVITGNVEWPIDASGNALPLRPEGVRYHVAPLAIVSPDHFVDLRLGFSPATGVSLPAPAAAQPQATSGPGKTTAATRTSTARAARPRSSSRTSPSAPKNG
jgi:Family of unknown function (DUF6519)